MGAGAQALGVLQPTSRGVPPPTFGVCCWRAPGAPGPGSGQLPFGSEAANEEGAAGRGAGQADPPGSHTQLCWGVNRVLLWTCLHGALGLQGVVSTPGASNSRDSRHTRLPHGWLSARSVPAKSSHLSRPRSPASPLSKPQVQQVSPDAPRLRLCPQRPQTLPHPLTPRGLGPPHLLLPGFQGPLGSAPVPTPPTTRFLPQPPHMLLPQHVRAPPLQSTKPETPPSPSMSPQPSFKQGSDPGGLR